MAISRFLVIFGMAVGGGSIGALVAIASQSLGGTVELVPAILVGAAIGAMGGAWATGK